MDDAHSLLDFPFTKNIAFMPGNEGTGLSKKQKEAADLFVFIPQVCIHAYIHIHVILQNSKDWLSNK